MSLQFTSCVAYKFLIAFTRLLDANISSILYFSTLHSFYAVTEYLWFCSNPPEASRTFKIFPAHLWRNVAVLIRCNWKHMEQNFQGREDIIVSACGQMLKIRTLSEKPNSVSEMWRNTWGFNRPLQVNHSKPSVWMGRFVNLTFFHIFKGFQLPSIHQSLCQCLSMVLK